MLVGCLRAWLRSQIQSTGRLPLSQPSPGLGCFSADVSQLEEDTAATYVFQSGNLINDFKITHTHSGNKLLLEMQNVRLLCANFKRK